MDMSLGFKLIGKEKVSFHKDADGNDIVFDGGVFELNLEKTEWTHSPAKLVGCLV